MFRSFFRSFRSSASLYSNRTAEARSACRLARRMNNEAKARKCFEFAINTSPDDPHVLNDYGLFLEEKGEIFIANTLFCKAHILDEKSEQVVENKTRTQSLVKEILQTMFTRIEEKKNRLAVNRARNCVVEAERAAFHQFCYHTISLEGVQVDAETTESMKQAYDFAEQNLGTKGLSRDLLLGIHRRILGPLHPEAGKFRAINVLVHGHLTTDVRILDTSMNDFLRICNASLDNKDENPIELAANIHTRLVVLHPFMDGNGRVARMLMATILKKRGHPFVTIPKEEIEEYYEAIRNGQVDNNNDSFVAYLAKCTERSLDHVLAGI